MGFSVIARYLMKKFKTYIGLSNPKSPENVASVMRAAGNYGVDAVSYTGERYPRALRLNPAINKLSRKVGDSIALSGVSQFSVDCDDMKIVCVELVENALALPDFQHPDNAYYIF
ncbi:tRNA (guanosine(18)-2'-O)-methyltransferase, partial [hydrothermal vent metagenome]